MESIARIENIKYTQNYILIKGYAFIRFKDIDRNIEKELVIKNKKDDLYIKKLKVQLRTDITYLYKNDSKDYSMAGFEDIYIELDELQKLNGHCSLYIRIKSNSEIRDIPLTINLSEEKNKLRNKYYLNGHIKKVLRWKFKNNKYLHFIIEECSFFALAKYKYAEQKKALRQIKNLIRDKKYITVVSILIYKIVKKDLKKKNIWLIGERKDTAQDNSYHLFKYIKEKYSDINIYYVIDKKSRDYSKIKDYTNIIQWGSIKHTIYLLCCKYSINSYSEKPNMYTSEYKEIVKLYPYIIDRKKIFLQHGVIATSRINHTLHKNKADLDLFIVSSEFEKEHIVEEFGYKNHEVVVTGLCRWDNLNQFKVKNEILIMPTWRSWIKSQEELEKSIYFNKYISLLKNKDLIKILEENNYNIKFFPHYHMQKLIDNLDIKFNKRIKFVRQNEKTVQELLKESNILITDYSSITFDFGYMKKPVIFYQFDYDEFYYKHYNEGPIDHKKELFGDVVDEEGEVVNLIKKLLITPKMTTENEIKTKKFIKYRDSENCKRVMREIMNLE